MTDDQARHAPEPDDELGWDLAERDARLADGTLTADVPDPTVVVVDAED